MFANFYWSRYNVRIKYFRMQHYFDGLFVLNRDEYNFKMVKFL